MVKRPAVPPEAWVLFPTSTRQLTTVCNSNSRDPTPSLASMSRHTHGVHTWCDKHMKQKRKEVPGQELGVELTGRTLAWHVQGCNNRLSSQEVMMGTGGGL